MRLSLKALSFAVPLALVLLALAIPDAAASDGQPAAATERVLATMAAAIEGSPEMLIRDSSLGAQVAEIRSNLGAGAPTLSWQREGIGPGFEERSNAVDYLRVNLPFNPPWRRGASRSLREATGKLAQAGSAFGRLEVASLAGRLWLDLAAETQMAELVKRRVERLERALATQTRRYELGEISGSERAQLELELARERSVLRQLETLQLTSQQRLAALTKSDFPIPIGGDLNQLVEDTAADLPDLLELAEAVVETPTLRLAQVRGEVANAEAKIERSNAWGRPEVEFEWEHTPTLDLVPGFDAAGVRISFPLPLGREGRQKILAAEHKADVATAERERLHRELVARLTSAVQAARNAEAALESVRVTADQIAAWEGSLAEQFRLGAITYLVYLDGLSRLDDVRQGMIETRYRLLAARLELTQLLATDTYFPLPAPDGEGS